MPQELHESQPHENKDTVASRLHKISENPDSYWTDNQEKITTAIKKNYATAEVWANSPRELEIATRIHGSPSKEQLVTLLDSLSRQETNDITKRATILAHNLSPNAKQFLSQVEESCAGALNVVWLDSPIIAGAYQSWHCMMLATTANVVASFDSDSALPAQWAQNQIDFMHENSTTVAASAPMVKYNTKGVYGLYSRGVEFMHQTPWLSRKLTPSKQFRAGNMVAHGDAVRDFASKAAGSRKEDTFFASDCVNNAQVVGFNTESWTLNSGEALSSQGLSRAAERILFAIAWQLPQLKEGSRLNELAARRYVIQDVSRYAPWTKPFIDQWAANKPLTQRDIIEKFLSETVPQYRNSTQGLSAPLEQACKDLDKIAQSEPSNQKQIVTAADITDALDIISEHFYKTAILEAFNTPIHGTTN